MNPKQRQRNNMPLYVYKCGACDSEFNCMHSIKTTINICSLCNAVDNLSRIPQMVSFGVTSATDKKEVGDVVNEHIEEAKQQLSEEKEKLKQDYKP